MPPRRARGVKLARALLLAPRKAPAAAQPPLPGGAAGWFFSVVWVGEVGGENEFNA